MKTQSTEVIIFGYFVAVITASFAATLLVCLFFLFEGNQPVIKPNEIMMIYMIITFFVGVTSLPGYLLTLYAASSYKLHTASFYASGGFVTSLLAHVILAAFSGGIGTDTSTFVIISLPAGAFGGYMFYAVRRSFTGKKKNETCPSSSPSSGA